MARRGTDVENSNGFRIWHIMVAVVPLAVIFTVARFDIPCTLVAPTLLVLYLCGLLGIQGARWLGRRWRTGFFLGLLLGPLDVILACSDSRARAIQDTREELTRKTVRFHRST